MREEGVSSRKDRSLEQVERDGGWGGEEKDLIFLQDSDSVDWAQKPCQWPRGLCAKPVVSGSCENVQICFRDKGALDLGSTDSKRSISGWCSINTY
jgi:hypothetical protein